MQKAERLLAITLLLQARGKMTAEHLADLLGVSVRTIYRDINSLSLSHVPVSMDLGPGGGYFLPDESYIDPVTFTGEEAIALALGGAIAGGSRLFGDGDGLRQALIKLEAVLPEEYRSDVRAARERVLIDVSAWYRPLSVPPHFEAVRRAVWQRRQIDIAYQRTGRPEAEWRRIEPLGLVWKAGVWYLAAFCRLRRALRTFHLHRIRDVRPADEPVTPRPDFDLEAYWERSLRHFESLTVPVQLTVRVPSSLLPLLDEGHIVVREEADGSAVVQYRTDSIEAAVTHVLSLGPGTVVLEPRAVRDGVVAAAQAIAGSYDADQEEIAFSTGPG
jgi:predicted DNA-binding transcriptional regulator YafY